MLAYDSLHARDDEVKNLKNTYLMCFNKHLVVDCKPEG